MKRVLFFSIFLAAFLNAKGQDTLKPLLVREVYDFEVGDVFQQRFMIQKFHPGGSTKYKSYYQTTILDKQIVKDSIFLYKDVKEKDVDGIVIEYKQIDTILHVDSTIFYGLPSFVPKEEKDKFIETNSIYVQNNYGIGVLCDNDVRPIILGSGPILQYIRRYMKGLGLVYMLYDDYSYPIDGKGEIHTWNLEYYKKKNKEWGTFIDFTTSANDKASLENEVIIYPNPTNGIFFIKGLDLFQNSVQYEIYNLFGQLIKDGNNFNQEVIDMTSFPKGLYYFYLYSFGKNKLLTQKKIIIQ